MKIFLCVVGFLSAFVLVECDFAPEIKSQIDDCLEELGLIKDIIKKSPNFEDAKIKCFGACVLKKGDRLIGGKVSVDREMEFTTKYDPEKIDDSFKGFLTECVNRANEEKDDCAVAGSLYKCFFDKYGPME